MSSNHHFTIQYIGGPTAVIAIGGSRFLTDPTFDLPGDHPVGNRILKKLAGPAISRNALGRIDAVLLSHDQHPDNLDNQGRQLLYEVPVVFSTPAAQGRLGPVVRGLGSWEEVTFPLRNGQDATITALPARHGPPGSEPLVGEVTGFMIVLDYPRPFKIYISGDNASLEHVETIASKFGSVDVAVIFAGAARTALADGAHLTLTSTDTVRASEMLGAKFIVPLHFEHWQHFTEGRKDIEAAFVRGGLIDKLVLLEPGGQFSV